MTYLVLLLVTLMTSVFSVSRADAVCDVSIGGTVYGSIQAAVNDAVAGDTINVTAASVCTENVIIRNEKTRFTMDGNPGSVGPGATINPASGNVINVRGKGIVIQNFDITGGSNGIWINRGSNASISHNHIHGLSTRGIVMTNLAYAIIINNTIENNASDGIYVGEGSNARIGFAETSDAAASPNTISNNGYRGISIGHHSSARIAGNTITGNADDGVEVGRGSQADLDSNTINGNGTSYNGSDTTCCSGVNAGGNSYVRLGEDNPVNFLDNPNTTTANNLNFGIRCASGAAVTGHLGSTNQLNGAVSQFGGGSSANTWSTSCIGQSGGVPTLSVP